MEEVGHHHAVTRHSHSAWTNIAVQHPRTIARGTLSCLRVFQSEVLQHQCLVVLEDGSHGSEGRQLVVEEHAPVVARRHGQLSVGKCQVLQHSIEHRFLVPKQGLTERILAVLLHALQHQVALAKLLNYHILIGGVEIVVVLQCVVVVEVLTHIPFLGRLTIHESFVCGIAQHGIAVEGKRLHLPIPRISIRLIGIKRTSDGKHIGFPTVFFSFRVTRITCWHIAS